MKSPVAGPLLAAAVGDAGPDVYALQLALNRAGAKLNADGKYGAKTKAAVLAWQGKRGITKDGQAGPVVWETLRAAGHVRLDDFDARTDTMRDAVFAMRFQTLTASAILKDTGGVEIVRDLDMDLGMPLTSLPNPQVTVAAEGPTMQANIGAALVRLGVKAAPIIARFAARSAVWLRGVLSRVPTTLSVTRTVKLPSQTFKLQLQSFRARDAARGAARLTARFAAWLGAGLGLVSTAASVVAPVVKAGSGLLWLLILGAWALTKKGG